jgi:serine/threonine-protein kinase
VPTIGTTIGSIRLTAVLGRGGMGEVFEGFDETLHRRVAVKSLRRDKALDEGAKARFLHEARILSSLHHPNICLVHDFIEHDGDAFLVMEKVEGADLGLRIREGLDHRHKLDIAVQLADVLTAAHARGIVHRDLKPDNVMLTAVGQVKVLDFGIARLEGADDMGSQPTVDLNTGAGETTLIEPIDTIPPVSREVVANRPRTAAGTLVGTPAYMSPEQARGEGVSPASDIYSLGLILQYLFTGTPAFDPRMRTVELLHLAGRGESRPVEGLAGDLAGLIRRMKCIEPEDRPTAPVVAHRLRRIRSKPGRRVRWAAAAVLVVAAVGFGLKYTVDLRRERGQAIAAKMEAESARDEAEAVNEFLVTLLGSASPGETRGENVTVREVVDAAAAELPGRDDLDPDAKVRFLMIIGNVYRDLGVFEGARSALESSVELADREGPIEARLDAQARIELGMLELTAGSLETAGEHYRRAAEIVGQRMPDNLQARSVALSGLGHVQAREGRLAAAQESYEEALKLIRQVKPAGDPQIGLALGNLGYVMMEQGDWEAASEATSEALEIFEASLGPDHPVVARAANNLANCEGELGRLDAAYGLHGRVLEIREKVLGPDHPDTAQALANRAGVATQLGRYDEADASLDRAAAIVRAVHGEDHPERIHILLVEAELAEARGDLETAAEIAREAYDRATALEGLHGVSRDAEWRMLHTLLITGRPEDAIEVALETLDRRRASIEPGHELIGEAWVNVAWARLETGDEHGARTALAEAFRCGWTADDVTEPIELAALAGEVESAAADS